MRYVVGIDGGGSKTHALILDSCGKARGFGSSGGSNQGVVGLKKAVVEIERAVRMAIEQAGLTPDDIELAYYCLAGADLKQDYEMLTEAMTNLSLAHRAIVKNDTMAAMRAAITRSWGVAVICGSGINAAGRSPDGREIVFPSLGSISGDWGGGGQLSMEVIRLVMRAWDGRGEETLLTDLVLKHFGAASEEELLENLYFDRIHHEDLLPLVPLLFEAAEAGDEPARRLITQMGVEIAVSANAIIKRLDLQDTDLEVGFAGGVFKGKGPLLIDTATKGIHKVAPAAQIRRTRYEPVVGATLLALDTAGVTVDKDLYRSLENTLPDQLIQTREYSEVKNGS